MDPSFFEQPILNSPYEYPSRHWEFDAGANPSLARSRTLLTEGCDARTVRHVFGVRAFDTQFLMEEDFESALEAQFQALGVVS